MLLSTCVTRLYEILIPIGDPLISYSMSLNEVSNRDIKEEEVLNLVCAGYALNLMHF